MRRAVSEEFGEKVRAVVGSMSLRAADRKTGVNYATLGEMSMGKIPEMESVVKFARGFELDVNAWLILAGYGPVEDRECQTALSGVETLIGGLLALQDEFGRPVPIPRACGHVRTLTPAEAEEFLAVIRRELKENRY